MQLVSGMAVGFATAGSRVRDEGSSANARPARIVQPQAPCHSFVRVARNSPARSKREPDRDWIRIVARRVRCGKSVRATATRVIAAGDVAVRQRATAQARSARRSNASFRSRCENRRGLPPGIASESAAEDVRQRAVVGGEPVFLENNTDLSLPFTRRMRRAKRALDAPLRTMVRAAAFVRRLETREAAKKARFSRTRWSDDRGESAAREFPRKIPKQPASAPVHAEAADAQMRGRRHLFLIWLPARGSSLRHAAQMFLFVLPEPIWR